MFINNSQSPSICLFCLRQLKFRCATINSTLTSSNIYTHNEGNWQGKGPYWPFDKNIIFSIVSFCFLLHHLRKCNWFDIGYCHFRHPYKLRKFASLAFLWLYMYTYICILEMTLTAAVFLCVVAWKCTRNRSSGTLLSSPEWQNLCLCAYKWA